MTEDKTRKTRERTWRVGNNKQRMEVRIIMWSRLEIVMGRQGIRVESRELTAGCRYRLGGRSRLRQGGDVMDRQGMAWDVTFHDSGPGYGWDRDLV
jgi:hypothetical protein